jgi:hypothetical protein
MIAEDCDQFEPNTDAAHGLHHPPGTVICIRCRAPLAPGTVRQHAHLRLGTDGVWSCAPISGYDPPITSYVGGSHWDNDAAGGGPGDDGPVA